MSVNKKYALVGKSNQEKAEAALKQAKLMEGQIGSFIRAVSGKNMKVSFNGTGSCTSKDHVYLTPPLELGVYRVHENRKCSVYDEVGNSLCAACREQDSFMAVALHEAAHTLYKSFQEVTYDEQCDIKEKWVAANIDKRLNSLVPDRYFHKPSKGTIEWENERFHLRQQFDRKMTTLGSDANCYIALASQINPWLPVILNALEDARVNNMLHSYRAGTTRMFKVRVLDIMENGVYSPESGEFVLWSDAPLEAQLCLFGYLEASDYGLITEQYFSDEACEVWRDSVLLSLLDGVPGLSQASDAFNLAQKILARMNELGFLLPPEEEEEGTSPGPVPSSWAAPGQPGNEGSEEGESGEGEGSEEGESGEGEGSEEGDDSGEGEGAGEGEGEGGSESDDSGEGEGAGEGEGEGDPTGGEASGSGSDAEGDGLGGGGLEGGRLKPGAGRGEIVEQAREAQKILNKLMGHEGESADRLDERMDTDENGEFLPDAEKSESDASSWGEPNEDMNSAVTQGTHFDKPSPNYGSVSIIKLNADRTVSGADVCEHSWGRLTRAWKNQQHEYNLPDLSTAEAKAAQAVAELRKIFTKNRAVRTTAGQKSGKIDARTVGRKLKTGRVDVFKRKEIPTDISYAVVIGVDISGSTVAEDTPDRRTRLAHMKAAAYAQAELLHKAGIPFLFWCHTADAFWRDETPEGARSNYAYDLQFVEIKGWNEKWGALQKDRLATIQPQSANLDGHTMMAYRRELEARQEKVGILLYYTDGAMPAENRDEELIVLKKEVANAKQRKDLQVLCVGVLNNEPAEKYNIDTVRYDGVQDLSAVIKRLEKALSGR